MAAHRVTDPGAAAERGAGPEPGRPAPIGPLTLHRLLVATDGSANAELALAAAITAAERDHAALTLVTVVPDVVADACRWAVNPGYPIDQEAADREGRRILREAVARIPEEIPVHTIFRRGKAAAEILRAAREGDYDAILLGARGVGRVGALVGSVSHHVLHHAEIAVFVAHAPRERERASRRSVTLGPWPQRTCT